MTTSNELEVSPENNERRKVLKKLAIGSAAIAGCSVLPNKWTSPMVEFGALPAHAVTSGETVAAEETVEETTTEETTTEETAAEEASTEEETTEEAASKSTGSTTEYGDYWGRYNGNRPTWYFSQKMSAYPDQFSVTIDGCTTVEVTSNNGSRVEIGDVLVKQSDVSGRGMVVVGSASCYSKSAYIVY